MKRILLIGLMLATVAAFAQKKKKQDVEAILSMCGCYKISFNFAETFGAYRDYEKHKNYYSGGLEWVFPIEQSSDKIVMQHLLIVNDTMIVKHWRQDWQYENQDLYVYDKNDTWLYKQLPADQVKGQWTQKVFQVDDSPRYEGSATWVHYDGRRYWEATVDAPLPRREQTKRSDYNVMIRTNRHEIVDEGWLHIEDNTKMQRDENGDNWVAKEKGWNTYTKVDEKECQPAKDWWGTNKDYWADVRAVWGEVFATKQTLSLNMKVEDKVLFSRLFELGDELIKAGSYDSAKARERIRATINLHKSGEKLVSKN